MISHSFIIYYITEDLFIISICISRGKKEWLIKIIGTNQKYVVGFALNFNSNNDLLISHCILILFNIYFLTVCRFNNDLSYLVFYFLTFSC